MEHVPVMMAEVLSYLELKPGEVVVDGTLGLAGHAMKMAEQITPGGMLVGLDWDKSMLSEALQRLSGVQVPVKTYQDNYRELPSCLAKACADEKREPRADGVLLDLGLNNAQIEDESRGISFRRDAPLDMRMDRSQGEPASAYLNRVSVGELERVLHDFGDENWAKKIAQVVVDRRRDHPLKTTSDFVNCIEAAIPAAKRDKRIHFATRSFQAIRIAVNGELDGLEDAMSDIALCLAPGGRMVVLAYHSGEDRAVKHAFRDLAANRDFEDLTRKPITPSAEECQRNPKSRSAKLRAIRRK